MCNDTQIVDGDVPRVGLAQIRIEYRQHGQLGTDPSELFTRYNNSKDLSKLGMTDAMNLSLAGLVEEGHLFG